jgi:hypothetical protein
MNYEIIPQHLISASAEIINKEFEVHKGKRMWLVAKQDNSADNIYVASFGQSHGFGGRKLEFNICDGNSVLLQGPWLCTAESLKSDIGIDFTNKYKTFGVISRGYEDGIMKDVVYQDEDWTIGSKNRIKSMAFRMSREFEGELHYYQQTTRGSIRGTT